MGHRGALEALGVLSESQKEVDEEDQHRSQVEALEEEDLSYLGAQVDLRETERGKTLENIFDSVLFPKPKMTTYSDLWLKLNTLFALILH